MTIQLELDPETEARLKAQAIRHGVALEQYAGDFLRDNLPNYATGTGRLTREDLKAMREELSRGSEKLPILPPEATERASFYEDRL
jgi:plasmid stability protein